jgi:hypothetical protein
LREIKKQLEHWRKEKGEYASLIPSPPLKRKGKEFRKEADILSYKGRANRNAK